MANFGGEQKDNFKGGKKKEGLVTQHKKIVGKGYE
jgi:hypothetical protein